MSLCDLLESTPDKPWPSKWVFSFRNPFKMYGSPWFDVAWHEAAGAGNPKAVVELLRDLRAVNVPMAVRVGRGRGAGALEAADPGLAGAAAGMLPFDG